MCLASRNERGAKGQLNDTAELFSGDIMLCEGGKMFFFPVRDHICLLKLTYTTSFIPSPVNGNIATFYFGTCGNG